MKTNQPFFQKPMPKTSRAYEGKYLEKATAAFEEIEQNPALKRLWRKLGLEWKDEAKK